MKEPTKQDLNKIREQGYRPVVVGCFLYDFKVLLTLDKFNDWAFPQGGIENGELLYEALHRESIEEMGENFQKHLVEDFKLIKKEKLKFPKQLHGIRKLCTDEGKELKMIGKKYFFVAATATTDTVIVEETQFEGYSWVEYEEAYTLLSDMSHKDKKAILIETLEVLKNKGFIK